MRAVVIDAPGGPDVLQLREVDDPAPGRDDVLVRVASAGVNRADVLQRMGFYPPPPGASEVPGLEAAGEIVALGTGVTEWRTGDRVMALVAGGGYAELLAAPAGQVMRVPDSIDLIAAGGIPEVFITAHDNLFTRARLQRGESVLIHGGAGGVGTAAIQLARQAGCRVIVTAGSEQKLLRSRQLGAEWGINHNSEDFVQRVHELLDGEGADVILDVMGAAYLPRNVDALGMDGRLVIIGLQGGTTADIDLAALHRKRATIITTALRARPPDQKTAIVAAFVRDVMPGLSDGSLAAVIDRVVPLADAAAAHRALETGTVIGKVVLRVDAA